MPTVSKINPDIEEERKKVEFNVEEFTNWYHGGVKNLEEKRFFGMTFKSHKLELRKLNYF